MYRGRVDHNRHFTIKDTTMDDVITFVPNKMPGSFTTENCSFAACAYWLHIQLDEVARKHISDDVDYLFSSEAVNVSLTTSLSKMKFYSAFTNFNSFCFIFMTARISQVSCLA